MKNLIEKARQAGACREELLEAEACQDIENHPSAPYWAYWYAEDVIKGRWPEAEKVILKSAEWSYCYAKNVIKGRWPEAEKMVSKSTKWSYRYALYVIKGRWPEAEKM